MSAASDLKDGDYVLATKYGDGDPQDHWAVGFYAGLRDCRHFVVNEHGEQFRANGFRRVEKISGEFGSWILKNSKDVEASDWSVWDFLADFTGESTTCESQKKS